MRDLMAPIINGCDCSGLVNAYSLQCDTITREGENGVHLVAQEAHVGCSDGMPSAGHGRDVVEHVAFGLFDGAEVRNHFRRLHDDFSQKQRAGADDFTGKAAE